MRVGGIGYRIFFFFFITLEKVLKSPLGLELSDTKVYEPWIRAHLGTTVYVL
jgi:hypothetical protein